MIKKMLMQLGFGDSSLNTRGDSRRRHVRFPATQAEVVIGGRAYPLQDWSLSGVSFDAPLDARIVPGDEVDVTLVFSLPQGPVAVRQNARVVRAGWQGVAAEFTRSDAASRKALQRALDAEHARGFLLSQERAA